MPLFGSSKKGPQDLCKTLVEGLAQLEKGDRRADKASEEVSKSLLAIKTMLYGSAAQEPQAELLAQLAQEFYNNNIFALLVANLAMLDFEARKDACQIFNHLLRRQIGPRSPTVDFVHSKAGDILTPLVRGYERAEVAMVSGQMLRECIRYEPLAKLILTRPESDPDFYKFFTYVEMSTFDIASDAFSTFKELLTAHKDLASGFLEKNYDRVFPCYRKLLDSDNYVTKRQALKLLGELLLDRHNYTTMTKYISNPENLKLMMNLLRDKSKNIQFEAFHVFKVFVANPGKPDPILVILNKNKDKLVDFLQKFHTDRSEDEQFNDEKAYLIKQIKELGN